MYFEIENTPEHLRRARRKAVVPKNSPKEECPRLVIAPFSKTPQVVFENVCIGGSSERELEVFNPTKQIQEITLEKALPPGLVIHLPGDWLILEPETCYCLTMVWKPMQPTALRETIRFTNENRGRYDVIVVLKTEMNVTGKSNQRKGFKTSPGKMKKKTGKRSPVAIYKKKSEIIYNATTKIKKTVTQSTTSTLHYNVLKPSNRDNIPTSSGDFNTEPMKCPFDSPTSVDLNFDTSEIFSNMRKTHNENILCNTFDKSCTSNSKQIETENKLKPCNKDNYNVSASDLFDNITFTPLKSGNTETGKLEKGPQIILSLNSESDLDDSIELKSNKENKTHSIICITSNQQHPFNNLGIANEFNKPLENQFPETPVPQNKKIPNTSSPKEFSPNFSMNTEISRISDLSFLPQRFSTEKKMTAKIYDVTHELYEDTNAKLNSDTYTKDSPQPPWDCQAKSMNDTRPKDGPKICRQSLFRETQFREPYEGHYLQPSQIWNRDMMRYDARSPPRSITPPLTSIPEESGNYYDTQVLDKSDKHATTFSLPMNRTFDKYDRNSLSTSQRQSWSKKSVRAEPELWKVPTRPAKKSIKPKTSKNDTSSGKMSSSFDTTKTNKNISQNVTLNQIGNVYSQSATVDPFQSVSYFYDEEAVSKFEEEFKRWLNYILTPPADLESNIEQKIDVGKAWIENRNKVVPAAPTKEQVCSLYHNSHRLESLRRSARALLMSPEITQVIQKLNAQIEKKLIAVRNDKNLHLDVGLQKTIMELLLSYNPLWLRIGLEAIYGIVLPLKSNSDIEGLTTFIIQRMFKNPFLKNKNSKNSAPNMLLPAYMDALKKFTLKKFFVLVFFLDQAKQKKLISHDPCLFCRNAICKESREIIIRFTRELIAGIGDITKHLRPLGYVVVHKQSYLDEYKYAVHNIALDIRDGVRLTKVMEIISMKNGLLTQLRTPAISRLQKIHNVQVALNALKESDFVITGDISAQDIADGHREKTLSLLWQLIHVFRAPLFENAANVIQTWWRKKYQVILEKREEEERLQQKINNAASIIQCWWRRIQYNRLVEWQMHQVTTATIVLQKYCRMWIYRTRLRKMKQSVRKIEEWYKSINMVREAKNILKVLKAEKETLRHKSATVLQSYIRRWSCMKQFQARVQKVVLIQSIIRCFILHKRYLRLQKSVKFIQQKYRGKLLMKEEMQRFYKVKTSVLTIQSYYRMSKVRKMYQTLKKSVNTIEERYIALLKMRQEANKYEKLKQNAVFIQARIRGMRCRKEFLRQKNIIIMLQRRVRANQIAKRQRKQFLKMKNAAVTLQRYFRSYQLMKKSRQAYITHRKSALIIQHRFRALRQMKEQKQKFTQLRQAAITVQNRYRSLLTMRRERSTFLKLKSAAVIIQRQYRAQVIMKCLREKYLKLRTAAINLQRRYRAQLKMRSDRKQYLKLKTSCLTIQNFYKAYILGVQQRQYFLKQKNAAIAIQNWFRNIKKGNEIKKKYQESKQACVAIQRVYRAYIIGRKQRQEYIKIRIATVRIQNYYRSYIEMKKVREQFIQLKTATVSIQRLYRSHRETQKQRHNYLRLKAATELIQNHYRRYKEMRRIQCQYNKLRSTVLFIQRKFRSICAMKTERKRFFMLKQSTLVIQRRYRALLAMRSQRETFLRIRAAAIVIQIKYRALCLIRQERRMMKACVTIQRFFRSYLIGKREREQFERLKKSTIVLQRKYRSLLCMRKDKKAYSNLRAAAITIQRKFRARKLMMKERSQYLITLKACVTIQNAYRALLNGKKQRKEYIKLKSAAIMIQRWYRNVVESRRIRHQYLLLRNAVVFTQRQFRANRLARKIRHEEAAKKIQVWYRSTQERKKCRGQFLKVRTSVLLLQSIVRMFITRKRFLTMKCAIITIQQHYKFYKLSLTERQKYIETRNRIIKLQAAFRGFIARKRFLRMRSAAIAIQTAYRLQKQRQQIKQRREEAAICIQKNFRRYLTQSRYLSYRKQVVFVQKSWRGKLVTRLLRCDFQQKRAVIIKLQALIRGFLVRQFVKCKKADIEKERERLKRNRAASIIQAYYRGFASRKALPREHRLVELRRRLREVALNSKEPSMKVRNDEAMEVLSNMSDIEMVIRAFRSLEILTEVFPMTYNNNARSVVRRVYIYMSLTNRSISSIEVLKSAAALLVNLTRYKVTGPKIYSRDQITPILVYMRRFSNTETELFCILCTYVWLFAKYDTIREDLTEFLNTPENRKMLETIKSNVMRMKRMANNARNSNKYHTPQVKKFVSHTGTQSNINHSVCSTTSSRGSHIVLPSLEPDYGIIRAGKPRYFEDADDAITALLSTYRVKIN